MRCHLASARPCCPPSSSSFPSSSVPLPHRQTVSRMSLISLISFNRHISPRSSILLCAVPPGHSAGSKPPPHNICRASLVRIQYHPSRHGFSQSSSVLRLDQEPAHRRQGAHRILVQCKFFFSIHTHLMAHVGC